MGYFDFSSQPSRCLIMMHILCVYFVILLYTCLEVKKVTVMHIVLKCYIEIPIEMSVPSSNLYPGHRSLVSMAFPHSVT